MTAPRLSETPDIEAVLRAHAVGADTPSDTACRCDRTWRKDADHRAHVAQALAPVLAAAVREAEQRALREAADAALNESEDVLPQIRPVTRWLRDRADRIAVDAPEQCQVCREGVPAEIAGCTCPPDQLGVLAPRCPRCGWQAIGRPDDAAGRKAAQADVIQHKSVCPAETPEGGEGR